MGKPCCEHNLRVDPTINYCPTCGEKLKDDADPEKRPAQYQCAACCKAGEYRLISYGDAVKHCPNCGAKVEGGEVRDPAGFMACCGGCGEF